MGAQVGGTAGGRLEWSMAGVAAGIAGLTVSYLVGALLGRGSRVITDVADLVIELTPPTIAHFLIDLVGTWDKPLLLAGIAVLLVVAFVATGLLARRTRWASLIVVAPVVLISGFAAQRSEESTIQGLAALFGGMAAWLFALWWLTGPMRHPAVAPGTPHPAEPGPEPSEPGPARRGLHRRLLLRLGAVTGATVGMGGLGALLDSGRRQVERTRALLRLDQVTRAEVAPEYHLEVPGLSPWRTPNHDFYLIDTAVSVPSIDPAEWRLRIHGEVEQEIELTFEQLIQRQFTEAWITLCCVSNPVGGELIGNARWSGVRVADLLAEARPLAGADAVLQTSVDGWTCATPLEALTDDRNALLAVGMNGEPLPLRHGFPVRMVVPGLYGYVSATKWLVDLEVTRFDRVDAYWTERGWSELGPVKLQSRIDVPGNHDEVPAGEVAVAGVAWAQHTGVSRVEIAVDGGDWQSTLLAGVPNSDTWVQWSTTVQVEPGDHIVRVRATDANGEVQTGVPRDVVPDGATGWDDIEFTAT